jgi:hypothetical protein
VSALTKYILRLIVVVAAIVEYSALAAALYFCFQIYERYSVTKFAWLLYLAGCSVSLTIAFVSFNIKRGVDLKSKQSVKPNIERSNSL